MKKVQYSTFITAIVVFSQLIFTINFLAQAQEADQVWYNAISIPPSPNAAALGKFEEIPVDKSTGIPNITIPILDLNEGGIDFSISLSYHAGGIRVQDEASWVGLGWSLNAGGVITRTMRGLPDDHNNGYLKTSEKVPWSYIIDTELETPGLAERTYEVVDEIAKGYIDYEPDIFYYNIGGKSGSFLFDNHRNCVCVPYNGMRIEPSYEAGHVAGFTILDPDGLIYIFGRGGDYVEETHVNP